MKQYKIMNIIIILLSIIAIIAICSFFQISVLGKEYADIFGYTVFKTETGSMSPTIEIDDIVFVKLGNHDLNENDINCTPTFVYNNEEISYFADAGNVIRDIDYENEINSARKNELKDKDKDKKINEDFSEIEQSGTIDNSKRINNFMDLSIMMQYLY